jgi:TonB family protein
MTQLAAASPHRVGLALSAAFHGLLVLLLVVVAVGRATDVSPIVYAVELVAAPAPSASAPRRAATEAVATAPEQNVAPVLPPRRQTRTPPAEPAPVPDRVQRTDQAIPTRSTVEPLPGETPGTGQDIANIRIQGVAFQYPEYLRNIVTQVLRRWQQPTGRVNLTAEVAFTIQKDGSVTEIEFLKRSGSFAFDLAAQGAIEAAAASKAFGPLPDGFNGVSLPIAFAFEPRNR